MSWISIIIQKKEIVQQVLLLNGGFNKYLQFKFSVVSSLWILYVPWFWHNALLHFHVWLWKLRIQWIISVPPFSPWTNKTDFQCYALCSHYTFLPTLRQAYLLRDLKSYSMWKIINNITFVHTISYWSTIC